jgi:hypothetical protein
MERAISLAAPRIWRNRGVGTGAGLIIGGASRPDEAYVHLHLGVEAVSGVSPRVDPCWHGAIYCGQQPGRRPGDGAYPVRRSHGHRQAAGERARRAATS